MSAESTTVVKRTIRKTVTTSAVEDDDLPSTVKHVRTYQVYRGLSPEAVHRLEIKIKELEEALDFERQARHRAEKELSEVTFQFDSLHERLEEADGLSSAQSEISRRREAEILKLKKELELVIVQQETSEASLRKRHQEIVNDLNDQIEQLNRHKSKGDKERQQLVIEIDNVSSQLEGSHKARVAAESKLGSLDDEVRRLRTLVEDLNRQVHDLGGVKARLTQENFELHRQVQELDTNNGALTKAKTLLQQQLDDAKNRLDEESRLRSQLAAQLNGVQADFEGLSIRLEEESETSQIVRGNLARAQNDYQLLKNKYDKEVLVLTEELDDSRRKSCSYC